jgi:hypothetical protein
MLEIAVLLLPVFQVATLQLKLAQKVAVVAMFMFGIVYDPPVLLSRHNVLECD